MSIPIRSRKKNVPGLPKKIAPIPAPILPKPVKELEPHEARRYELFELHNREIPLEDIFVDRGNGVELYRNPVTKGWVTKPENRGR